MPTIKNAKRRKTNVDKNNKDININTLRHEDKTTGKLVITHNQYSDVALLDMERKSTTDPGALNTRLTDEIYVEGLRVNASVMLNTNGVNSSNYHVTLMILACNEAQAVSKDDLFSMGTGASNVAGFDSLTSGDRACLPINSGAYTVLMRKKFILSGNGMNRYGRNAYLATYLPIKRILTYKAGGTTVQPQIKFVWWSGTLGDNLTASTNVSGPHPVDLEYNITTYYQNP